VTDRWKLTLSYCGTDFHGFASQPGIRTVAGELGVALQRFARLDLAPTIVCAGRTDAGVHAEAQVVHVDLPEIMVDGRGENAGTKSPADGDALLSALNRQLGTAIVVTGAEMVGPDFDARHTAKERKYRYLIWNSAHREPLLAPLSWHVNAPLDIRSIKQAADVIIGVHDFRGFCRRPPDKTKDDPIVRVVFDVSFSEQVWLSDFSKRGAGTLYRFDIAASSFCHQMVRSLVASLIEVGKGKATMADMAAWLRSTERVGAFEPAPSNGLTLVSVRYE
jgi:tRNA pseudouridine38-40 synthase